MFFSENLNLVDLFRQRAQQFPERSLYAFLGEDEELCDELTFGQLDLEARALAARLQALGASGERALLLFPSGLDFIRAFVACLYSGVVAVPAYPPANRRQDPRLLAIATDSSPAFCLAPERLVGQAVKIESRVPALAGVRWLAVDEARRDLSLASAWRPPAVGSESLAFLQYTSGSTADPKGVMVLHGNLLHNLELIRRGFGESESSVVVGWLPIHHDMGLIGNVLQPAFVGGRCVLMSPTDFLRKPLRWLQAIQKFRGTTSGGPDFAYQLCVDRIGEEAREDLDLSSWSMAFNGAEPVRARTLDRFRTAFEPCGFRGEAFYPCFGLAEATLFVAGGTRLEAARVESFESSRLERNEASLVSPGGAEPGEPRRLVSCGRAWLDQEVAVADPESGRRLPEGRVGEIRVRGLSVASGYWGKPEESARTFAAPLSGEPEGGSFLRTGDLGFQHDGELFVTGRIKELIVLRGRNLYPHDLEGAAATAHPLLRPHGAAAFTVEEGGSERLVLVLEVSRPGVKATQAELRRAVEAVRQAVAETWGAAVWAVELIKPATLLKTSSGKVRRRACRAAFLDGTLTRVGRPPAVTDPPRPADPPEASPERSALVSELRSWVAPWVELPVARLATDRPLSGQGLDSLRAAQLASRVEEEMGVALSLVELLDGLSLEELAATIIASRETTCDGARGPLPAIERHPGRSHPLSFGQEALWFLHALAPESSAYHLTVSARLRGTLDEERLEGAWRRLAQRHPSLRTRFVARDQGVTQEWVEEPKVDFSHHPAAGWSETRVGAWLEAEAGAPFNLEIAPLARLRILTLAPDRHLLLLVMHHIVADFAALEILMTELAEFYRAASEERFPRLSELSAHPGDYARWQRRRMEAGEWRESARFWREALSPFQEPVDLPSDRPRPAVQTFVGGVLRCSLDQDLSSGIFAGAQAAGTTAFTWLLAAFQLFVGRWSDRRRVVVGTPNSTRGHRQLEGLVGYLVNPLAIAGQLPPECSWDRHVTAVRSCVLDAVRHGDYPFEGVVQQLQLERDTSRSPLFQLFFAWQQSLHSGFEGFALGSPRARVELAGLEWSPLPLQSPGAAFDLSLTAGRVGDRIDLEMIFNRDLFDLASVERMLSAFVQLVTAAVADPRRRLMELPLLATEARHQILCQWGAPREGLAEQPAPPHRLGLHHWIDRRALAAPEAVAVVVPAGADGQDRDQLLTYGSLRRAWRRIAGELTARGLPPETPVAVALDRCAELLPALLGVLAAGGAYLPLDLDFPGDRLRSTVEDALSRPGPRLLLTRRRDRSRVSEIEAAFDEVIEVDTLGEGNAMNEVELAPHILPGQLAYLIYTSGSTGIPKGVQIPHAAVWNFLASMATLLELGAEDSLLAVTTVAFDISVMELFLPLVTGGRTVLAGRGIAVDGRWLARTIEEHSITAMQATPASWRLLVESGWRGCSRLTILAGGEALAPDLGERLSRRGAALWNLYGPTETTIWSAARRVSQAENPIRVGGILGHTRIHLLDSRLEPQPPGVVGEVWIGGEGLARGYAGRPRLTAQQFVPDPFAERPGRAGGRLYRVGDRGRFLDVGEMELLGRLDGQVKVRGHRVELGEIEAALRKQPGIEQAVVVLHGETAEEHRLIAHLVTLPDHAEEAEVARTRRLRGALRRALPGYMVPAFFLTRQVLPLTPNGKVDRRRLTQQPLPAPAVGAAGTEATAPRHPSGEVERAIARIWSEALGVESVGLEESFFDLGGHSVLLARVHRQLVDHFDRPELTVVDLFRHVTVSSLARFLASGEASIEVAARADAPVPRRASSPGAAEPVAIIGMAGRFPGAANVEQLWRNLCRGEESITSLDRDQMRRWVDGATLDRPEYVAARGLLAGAEEMDAAFFGFTPREAEILDPQHRLFLECAWQAMENAGYPPGQTPARVALFASAGINSYLSWVGEHKLRQAAGDYQAFISNDKDFLPTRVSYKLNLRGPSVNVQSACSSSLVAVHLACNALAAGEAEMALAGGVAIRFPQEEGYLWQAGAILSPDGHCRAFDASAAGTVLGNGLGVVMLKPLSRARQDGDRILAVIRGSAINNDGSAKMGYTAPSPEGQREVLRMALDAAGVDPATVGYIEAHGTGTELGDPVEVTALREAYALVAAADETGSQPRCALGSVKSNLGHLDTAAGVVGLIKAVLTLDRGQIPPSLHFEKANPKLGLEGSRFYVNDRLRPWPRTEGRPRRAAVSSFGIGGTNVHLVLEEAPPVKAGSSARPWQLLTLSARSAGALDQATQNLVERLSWMAQDEESDPSRLADVAYTLQVGRPAFDHRRWWVASDLADALRVVRERQPERLHSGRVVGTTPGGGAAASRAGRTRVHFLFSGQGAQHLGMAARLYEAEPVFRAQIDRGSELLTPELGIDPRSLLLGPEGSEEEKGAAADLLRQTRLAQPTLCLLELALAGQWRAWGVEPAALLGHSLGELSAATLAGVFAFEDALRVVAARGKLMQEQPPGRMLGVGLGEEEVAGYLEGELSLAAVNGPADCVLSGSPEAIEELVEKLASASVRCRLLHTSHAFHSPMMEPAVEPLVRSIEGLSLSAPTIPFVSNLSGTWITEEEARTPSYWGRLLVAPVYFSQALATLAREPGAFLEIGPGRTLTSLGRSQLRSRLFVPSLPHPNEAADGEQVMTEALGRLWQEGVEVDWSAVYARRGERRHRLPLPSYPFERKRYSLAPESRDSTTRPEAVGLKLESNPDPAAWLYAPRWRQTFSPLASQAPLAGGSAPEGEPEQWLVVAATAQRAAALGDRCDGPGRHVRRVVVTDPPRDAEGWRQLWADLGGPVRHLIDALELDSAASQTASGEETVRRLTACVRALAATPPPTGVMHWTVLTRGAHSVLPGEVGRPSGRVLSPLMRVAGQELRWLRWRVLDLPEKEDELSWLSMLEEAAAPAPEGKAARQEEVAYRGGERWSCHFESVPIGPNSPARLAREGGAYLVTGGLGGVGFALAKTLAAASRGVRLALLSREAGATRSHKDTELVRELEGLGARVTLLRADVTEGAPLSAAVGEAIRRFGGINGVIHAAGIAGGGALASRDAAHADRVLAPKMEGTRRLWEATQGQQLDFFVVCSSINSVVGGYGQGDYAAANGYLDGFAEAHDRRGSTTRVLSLSWDRWRGVGMSAAWGGGHPLLGLPLIRTPGRELFRVPFTVESQWVLSEHRIAGWPTVPGSTYLEMARAAFEERSVGASVELRGVTFLTPLSVAEGAECEVWTVLDFDLSAGLPAASFRVISRDGDTTREHCRGSIAALAQPSPSVRDLSALRHRLSRELPAAQLRARANHEFLATGSRWRTLQRVSAGEGSESEVLAELALADDLAEEARRLPLHPALLDVALGCIQLLHEGDYLPLAYERLVIEGPLPSRFWSHLTMRSSTAGEILTCDGELVDEKGQIRVRVEGFSMRRTDAAALAGPRPVSNTNAAVSDSAVLRAAAILEGTIEPEAAGQLLLNVLADPRLPSHLVISPRPFEAVAELYDRFDPTAVTAELSVLDVEIEEHERPELETEFVDPGLGLEREIAAIWRRLLGLDRIGARDNFFELGGTSLIGVQVIDELKTLLGRDVPTVSLFEAPTVAALAQYLAPDEAGDERAAEATRVRVERKKRVLARGARPHRRRATEVR